MSDDRLRVLDTDTVSHHQAGRTPVVERALALPPDQVVTTVVTVREHLRGRLAVVDRTPDDASLVAAFARLQRTLDYFTRVRVLPFDEAACQALARLRGQGIRIGTQDLRIAAIVLSAGGILVTSNLRDFARVNALEVEDWMRT